MFQSLAGSTGIALESISVILSPAMLCEFVYDSVKVTALK